MSDKIQQAAINLFRDAGSDFTLDQLARLAEISRATLYRRIGSKESLLKQLADDGLIEMDPEGDVKNRAIRATRKVVADTGFIACTMEQIAREAGLGVATLYRHFGDKENLLSSFIAQMKPRLDIKSILSAKEISLEQDLRKVLNIALEFFGANPDLLKILYSMQTADQTYLRKLRKNSDSTIIHIARYLARHQKLGALRKDVSAEDLAQILHGLLVQFSVIAPTHSDRPLNVKKDAETILKVFLKGAAA